MCPKPEKKKGVGLFLEPTLCGQDLQIDYCLEDSWICSISVSMYFTKSIKYFFIYFIVHVLLPLSMKSYISGGMSRDSNTININLFLQTGRKGVAGSFGYPVSYGQEK